MATGAKPGAGNIVYPSSPVKVVGGAPPKAVTNSGGKKTAPKAPVKTVKPSSSTGNVAAGFDPSNPATWGAGLNSAQLSAIVSSQIGDAINPQVADLKQQQTYADQQAQTGEQSLQNYYAALAKAVGGEAPAVSGAYNSAAQAVGQVGQGLTGAAGAQMEAGNAQDQQLLQNAGQGQASGYIAGQANPGGAALNPWFTANALSPAESLAGTGAAKATAAAAQPGIFAATGADALTSAIQKAAAGDTDFQQKIATIYTQVPSLREKILTDVQNYETSQRQLKDTETELGITAAKDKGDLDAKEKALEETIANNAAKLKLSTLTLEQRGQIAAAQIAANKALVILRGQIAAAGKTGKSVTPTSKAKWLKLADTFYNGVWPKQRWDANSQTYKDVPGTGTAGVDYPVALARLMAAGATRGQAITILNTYYAPGERGRGLPKVKGGVDPKVQAPDGTVIG